MKRNNIKQKIPPQKIEKGKLSLMALILFVFGLLLYVNTWTHRYAQDDAIVIHDNMFTTQGIDGIIPIFTHDTFYGFFKEEGKDRLVSGGRYRPLSLASFAIEWELFGKNPAASHIINSILYGLLGIMLFFTLIPIFSSFNKEIWLLPMIATSLYLAHPIHTEVVANIKGRDEIFSMLFSILSLFFVFRMAYSKKFVYAVLSFVSLLLGCLSKENAISFLLIVPLSLWFFSGHPLKRCIYFSVPAFSAVLIYILIRGSVIGFDPGAEPVELMNNPFVKIEENRYVPFTWNERMGTILYTWGKYLQLMFFPHPLTHDYYPRHIPIMKLSDAEVVLSAIMFLCMIVSVFAGIGKKRIFAYAILFFLITFFLVSNLIFPVGTNMSERFMFMPSLGWCLFIASIFVWAKARINQPAFLFGVLVFILGLMSFQTIARNRVWKDDFTLFTTDIHVSGKSAKLRNAVGGVLSSAALQESNEKQKERMIMEAIENLEIAIEIHPNYKNAHLILGNCYFYLKKYTEAEKYYGNALRLDPQFQDAIFNYAVNDRELGRYYGSEKGDLDRSLQYLERAYRVLKDDYETVRLMGTAYGYLGQHEKAIEYFLQALKLAPLSVDANKNVAKAYFNTGNHELGNHYLNQAIKIDPNAIQ